MTKPTIYISSKRLNTSRKAEPMSTNTGMCVLWNLKNEESPLDKMPKYGYLQEGKMCSLAELPLQKAPPANIVLLNDGRTSARIKPENRVTWTEKSLRYWATPRVACTGACRNLTKRGACDLPTQLRFEKAYVESYKPDERGTVASPAFVEWLQGLECNWTSTTEVPRPLPALDPERRRLKTLDLFTGCGGLTTGLREWSVPVGYCEFHPEYRKIIEARINTGHLEKAPVWNDVRSLTAESVTSEVGEIDMICGGFPCQDISLGGKKRGLEGSKSGLFYEVRRLIKSLRPPLVFLENVAGICGKNMASVWQTVLRTFDEEGYNARWIVIQACHAGSPQKRERWFLLAIRDESSLALLSDVASVSAKEQAEMASTWRSDEPALPDRMLCGMKAGMKVRLQTLGNMVNVAQASLAWRLLAGGYE